jgi:signal transduction histidine kinase
MENQAHCRQVRVITNDETLHKACRRVLSKLNEFRWKLTMASRLSPEDDGDLFVWDYEAEPSLYGQARIPCHKKVFLVRRENLAALQELLTGAPARVLLKPLKLSLFRTMVQEIVTAAGRPHGPGPDLGPPQENRDELFQSMIEFSVRVQEYEQSRTDLLADQIQRMRSRGATIQGYAKLLADGQLGPLTGEQQEVARRMCQASRALQRLATSILHETAGIPAAFAPRIQAVDMRALVESAVSEVLPVANLRKIDLVTQVEPAEAPLSIDAGLIEHVLVRLLDEASRLAPKKGRITVQGYPVFWDQRVANIAEHVHIERRARSKSRPNAYRIEVRDNRSALRWAAATQIFEQLDLGDESSAAHPHPGPAEGLGLCRQIIELHRGQLFAVPGEEACFAFVLPNAGVAPPVEVVPLKPDFEEYVQ